MSPPPSPPTLRFSPSTTSTTPALVVPATVAVDLAVSSLIHLGCFSDPRGVSPAAPTTSSTPSLAVAAAVAVDLAISSAIQPWWASN
ncbi:hypothetical protein MSAN_02528100 [Mycena sanguinolenta]|uniref:Uncharacterized protein n=1 Tax=Mycena sanguinolenta TaxID=230812 RepID=A0A8H6TYY8_9AGAR|nr:hypothetical protein MSAN_02528100 [Mycena sanguinolenta]